MYRKYFPMIGAVIGLFSSFIPSVFLFVNNLVNQLLAPLLGVFHLLSKLNLPTGLTGKILLSICMVVIILALVKNNKKVLIVSLVTFLFVGAYIYSVGLILNFVYTAIVGYCIGFLFYKPRSGIIAFIILATISIEPTIYAVQQYKEFLKYSEEADKIQLLGIGELAKFFNVSEQDIQIVIEKYKIPGGTDTLGSTDWKYATNRIEEALIKEDLLKHE